MRIYSERLGRFLSADPITSKYAMLTPYQFASNSPISGIDLDGLEYYYAADGGFIGQGFDKENVEVRLGKISGTSKSGKNVITSVDLNGKAQENWTVIHQNINEFKSLAGVLYAESDGRSSQAVDEVAGIVDVLKNRANYEKTTINEQATVKKGVYGAGVSEANKINTEKGPNADNKRKAIYGGLVKGLVSKVDISNGAFYWDGKDFNGVNKIHGGNTQRYKPGYTFSDKSHDLFKQGDNKVQGLSLHGTWEYKYESTAAEGKTTFSRLTEKYRKAQYGSNKIGKSIGNGHE